MFLKKHWLHKVMNLKLLVCIALIFVTSCAEGRHPAGLIIYNGPIFSANDKHDFYRTIVISDGTIIATGGDDLLEKYKADQTINLEGRLALPGFNDAHTHLRGRPDRWISLSETRSITALQNLVRQKAEALGAGAWITGYGWSEDRLEDARKPSRLDLDAVAPNNPVFLTREGGHSGVANSLALEIAALSAASPNPDGGVLERFDDGALSGVIRERRDLINRHIPDGSPAEIKADLEQRLGDQFRLGITSLTDASTSISDYRKIWSAVYEQSRSPLPRATVQINSGFGNLSAVDAFAQLTEFGLQTGDGDERLKVGPLKVFVDGGFTGPAAWTREPYKDDPDYFGSLSVSLDELAVFAAEAHEAGWQLGFHTIGDAAIEETVDIFSGILERAPRADHRHFLNHFTVMPTRRTMKFMADHGIGIIQQPNFTYSLEGRYTAYLSGPRLAHNNSIATPIGYGIKMAFSSDIIPMGPLVGVYAAVTRKGDSGAVYGSEERVDVLEALRMYTAGGAYFTFEEHKKGQISLGMMADIVILDRDITRTRPKQILDAKVDITILNGEVVYERGVD